MLRRFLPDLLPILVLVTAQFAAGSAPAQGIRPGLWQINNKMRSANPELDQAMAAMARQMASLTPEQRKTMEQMVARQGMTMPAFGADGAIGVQACVTPEMAARRQIPLGQQGDCKSDNVTTDGGMKIAFTCANPPSRGEGRLTLNGDSAFSMALNVTTSARGKPEQVSVDTTGKWLAANCPAGVR